MILQEGLAEYHTAADRIVNDSIMRRNDVGIWVEIGFLLHHPNSSNVSAVVAAAAAPIGASTPVPQATTAF
jgi:hypothetical protein